MRRAPAVAHALAIAHAMLRLFATPKTRPTFPARICSAITPTAYAPFLTRKIGARWPNASRAYYSPVNHQRFPASRAARDREANPRLARDPRKGNPRRVFR